ncbi:MAG: hypothetical protein U9R25_01315 [Chloroflexota bacterium]|nr:hypothetical protein [Chloroflexota bacterium]
MKLIREKLIAVSVMCLIGMAACAQPAPSGDQIAQGVETALALTAEAESGIAQSVEKTVAARATEAAAAEDSAAVSPTDTPAPPTDTAVPPTDTPVAAEASDTPVPDAAPTETPFILSIGQSDVDGDDGNDFLRGSSNSNQGRVILLPGFEQSQVADPMVFQDSLVFQVEIFDVRDSLYDGAGIQEVLFSIETNDDGQVVYEHSDSLPPFCVFGGEAECQVLPLIPNRENHWPAPSGLSMENKTYLARIDIVPENGDTTQWRWRFELDIAGLPETPPSVPNTASINHITHDGSRYLVDFETFGFEAVLPGQHVHFFYDTVPPEQAGMPGSGPWILYGGPTPFGEYTVDSRPSGATLMCILVANPDHSVIAESGNCYPLP